MQNGQRVHLPSELDLMINISLLRADIAELRVHLARKQPEADIPSGWTAPIIGLIREAKEFIEAVASLKEIALAIAIITASTAVMSHPETVTAIIASYNAVGHGGRE